MATSYSPSVAVNGLALYLDAANPKSYPGSGTTWYDLSGNGNNATLINGPTFNTSKGGYIQMDGADDYAQIPDSSSLRFTTGFTQIIWVKLNNTITDFYRNLFGKPNYVCYGMIVEWYGGNPILADFLVGGIRNPIGLGYPSTNWVMVAQTYDSGGGSNNHVLYLRGGATDTIYGTSTGNVDINTEPVRIGQAGLQVDVAAAMLYNRALSSVEITQNYNALRTRFGV